MSEPFLIALRRPSRLGPPVPFEKLARQSDEADVKSLHCAKCAGDLTEISALGQERFYICPACAIGFQVITGLRKEG
ncbi:MAG TPA: hypothetical protein VL860_10185 [Planctomycetota bacterium]|nr:hypothetical protein [Planctomycetota bacterium]